jgi:mannose-1-phosphate guanylyltransferase/mannose-6-phosphate isomerase
MAGDKLPLFRAVVLAGGGGTRFWPASRGGTPKQCLRLLGNRTLLEATLARIEPLGSSPATIVVTEALAPAIEAAAGKHPHRILREPTARNTAAACALAVRSLSQEVTDPRTVVAIFPADHFVGNDDRFREDLRHASRVARESGDLVVLGVPPVRPDTGYGYAEVGALRPDGARAVVKFHEKPDGKTAERYLASGTFFWNAGIFVATLEAFVRELEAHAPAIWTAVGKKDLAAAYASVPAQPFDVALVERSSRRALVEARFPWSDVGTWLAVSEALSERADRRGNLRMGEPSTAVVFENSARCVVHADTLRAVGVLGLDGVVVAEKDGRLLVASLEASQQVKDIAAKLES